MTTTAVEPQAHPGPRARRNPFATTLRAFHGDATTKATYLARVRAHAAADEIVQGTYWQNGRGCAVGCTIHGSEYGAYEEELGVPRVLACLEERLFELMALSDAKGWPERFLGAIPVGADLDLVWPRFAHWMLVDETDGVIWFADTDQTRVAIAGVAALYRRVIDGEAVSRDDFASDARAAAWAARAAAWAASDARAAARAARAAAWAARAAAWAASDARAAAWDAAWAAAWDASAAARQGFALRASGKLAELLATAPVPAGAA